MNALLVWPKFESFSFWHFEKVYELAGVKYITPPLGLLTVASLLPRDWELRLVDENVRELTDEDIDWAELVLVGAKIIHRPRALAVIRRAKDRGKLVAVGGTDPTLSTSYYEDSGADYLCVGEGEVTVPMLLADLAQGVTGRTYRCDRLPDVRNTPPPRFDLVNLRDYLYVGIQYSRGCPHHCEFCNVVDLFHSKYRTKTLEQVLVEFDLLYSLGYRGQVDFFDDNLIGHFNDAKPLLRGLADWLKAHNYPFFLSTSITINVARDPEIMDLLREARFKAMLVGIETPDENALKIAHKGLNTGFSIPEAARQFYTRAGATIHSGFLLGLDGESDDIGDRIIRCIDEACIPWVMAGVVFPLPGTQLSLRLDREGRLFPRARGTVPTSARDQISAGIQFKTQRPALDVLDDLLRIMQHSFDPTKYFERCTRVAVLLNTIPNLLPGWRVFLRNVRTFLRLCVAMTLRRETRGPFWKAVWTVVFNNPRGLEALATLAVLYVHFQSMLPYCYEQLRLQRAEIESEGEERWLERNLREPEASDTTAPARRPHERPVTAVVADRCQSDQRFADG
ncbi:MAG: B12-binding domain-containing radical SAM protein [Polyangiaceae bacterium]|nr:B12-binding domain-containing radical SAM protein [Polyangiaceae bacterium]